MTSATTTTTNLHAQYDTPHHHPLVLLSVTDHHAHSISQDKNDSKMWFLDHNYIEGMYEMFKKANGNFFSLFSLKDKRW